MTIIKITPDFNDQLNTIREAGKTPWVIINEDYAVGAYSGRTQAREAKASGSLEGKILKADEIEFEVVDLAAAAQALHDEATFDEIQESGDLEDRLDAAFAAADAEKPSAIQDAADAALEPKAPTRKIEVTNESTAERPCKLVWHIVDEMKAANPEVKRKEVLAECVKRGVAFYTARTQYQQWLGVQKEMAARVASQTAE